MERRSFLHKEESSIIGVEAGLSRMKQDLTRHTALESPLTRKRLRQTHTISVI
jgi:hypothetical protein